MTIALKQIFGRTVDLTIALITFFGDIADLTIALTKKKSLTPMPRSEPTVYQSPENSYEHACAACDIFNA